MSNIPEDCRRIESRLAEHGLTTRMFCDRLGIKMSTFWRWREGRTEPYVSNWSEATALVETMVTEVTKRSKGNGVIAEKQKAADQKAGSAGVRPRRRAARRRG